MGGSNNNAQRQAQQAEQQRQQAITRGTQSVQNVFSDPKRQTDIESAISGKRDYLTDDLNRQKEDSDRQLRFAMTRTGQHGGSVDTDLNARQGEDYVSGLLRAEQKAQGFGTDIRSADQQAQNQLLSMVQGGLDATTAGQNAALAMRNNLNADQSGMMAHGLGEVFGNTAEVARKSKELAEERRMQTHLYNLIYQSPLMQPPRG